MKTKVNTKKQKRENHNEGRRANTLTSVGNILLSNCVVDPRETLTLGVRS